MRLALRPGAVAAAVFAVALPAAAQQQVRVTGTTTADALLIKDTLQTILQFAYSRDECEMIGEVKPQVLADYSPAQLSYRTEEEGVTYERWDVELCEKQEAFLVAFWPSEAGGTLFKISYPPPGDLPPEVATQSTKSSIGT